MRLVAPGYDVARDGGAPGLHLVAALLELGRVEEAHALARTLRTRGDADIDRALDHIVGGSTPPRASVV